MQKPAGRVPPFGLRARRASPRSAQLDPGWSIYLGRKSKPVACGNVVDVQTSRHFLLGRRRPSLTRRSMELSRRAFQHIDGCRRDCSRGSHAAARRMGVLRGEGVALRELPDALQILVSHQRHPLGEVVLVMSQQGADQRSAPNVERTPILIRRHRVDSRRSSLLHRRSGSGDRFAAERCGRVTPTGSEGRPAQGRSPTPARDRATVSPGGCAVRIVLRPSRGSRRSCCRSPIGG